MYIILLIVLIVLIIILYESREHMDDQIQIKCWIVKLGKDVLYTMPISTTVGDLKQKLINELRIHIDNIYVIKNMLCDGEAVPTEDGALLTSYVGNMDCTNIIHVEIE